MDYRPLGNTGLEVSVLTLGTVSLGVDYGISAPGQFGRPDEARAIGLLHSAAAAGVNLFDTAPNYGAAEALLGKALGDEPDCLFATKVSIPRDAAGACLQGAALQAAVMASVEGSRKRLRRDVLDILQIHNATEQVLADGALLDIMADLQAAGRVTRLGVSVYTEAEAMAAMATGRIEFLQIAYNLLDQRIRERVLPAAGPAGTAVGVRSAFLKGVLSAKAQWLPAELQPLREAAARARDLFGGDWADLPGYALRFCLSDPRVATVLVGPRTVEELEQALAGAAAGPLDDSMATAAADLALRDAQLLNPANWPVP